MLSATIEDIVTKEDKYLYLKEENNKLIYYGYSIQNANVKPIEKNIISKIYNLLRVNENCIYIEDYLDYKVYLDRENNIKHYLKNGVEDFVMLFENNGESLILYNNSNDKENNDSKSKKFKIGNFNIKLSKKFISNFLPILIGLSIGSFISTPICKNIIVEFKPSMESITTSNNTTNVEITSKLEPLDYQDAIDLINLSYLSPVQKKIATNDSLLKDVFEYYKDTNMEYVIRERLSNLKVELFSKDYMEDALGFYNVLQPNVIHVREDIQGEDTFKHELIHVLQSKYEYIYLTEATAGIVSYEYLDSEITTYQQPISNTRLLIDVIGPKMIWETIFGGNDTNFLSIIRSNLNESEANELISYLKQKPVDIDDIIEKERIPELISNLYRNINLKDIKDDRNIYDADGNHVDKIYFNEDKMVPQTKEYYDIEVAHELGLVYDSFEILYLKPMSDEKYNQIKDNLEYTILADDFKYLISLNNYNKIIINKMIIDKNNPLKEDVELYKHDNLCNEVSYNKGLTIDIETIPEAILKGIIKINHYEIVTENNLTKEERKNYELINVTKCVINNGFVTENYNQYNISIDYNENKEPIGVQVTYGGLYIKEMFPDQMVRSQNNYNVIK